MVLKRYVTSVYALQYRIKSWRQLERKSRYQLSAQMFFRLLIGILQR
jgi:hypothetical protein